MNHITRQQLRDALAEIEHIHTDFHVEDPETRNVDIVPSLALTLTGVGHEALLHEGEGSDDINMRFCPGCRVIRLVQMMHAAIDNDGKPAPDEPVETQIRFRRVACPQCDADVDLASEPLEGRDHADKDFKFTQGATCWRCGADVPKTAKAVVRA